MHTIKSLEGHRWFIWTLVFVVVAGVALTAYISLSGDDSIAPWPTHKVRKTTTQQNQKPSQTKTPTTSQSKPVSAK